MAIVGVLREGETVGLLRQTHPHLHVVHFYINGATTSCAIKNIWMLGRSTG